MRPQTALIGELPRHHDLDACSESVRVEEAVEIMRHNIVRPKFFTFLFGHDSASTSNSSLIQRPDGNLINRRSLIERRTTHTLVYIGRSSIKNLCTVLAKRYNTPIIEYQEWYESEKFANHAGREGWHLICKRLHAIGVLPDLSKQINSLPRGEIPVPSRIMAHAIALHYLATTERLAPTALARCSDKCSNGYLVKLGFFGREGFRFVKSSCRHGNPVGNIGIPSEFNGD